MPVSPIVCCIIIVSDTVNYLDMSRCCQQVATSRCNGIWRKHFTNHNTTDTTDFSRANLLRNCYGETGVMDFGLNCTISWPLFTVASTHQPYTFISSHKVKIHYTSFPVARRVTSLRQQKSVVSVVSCRFPNSITATCYGLVSDTTNYLDMSR